MKKKNPFSRPFSKRCFPQTYIPPIAKLRLKKFYSFIRFFRGPVDTGITLAALTRDLLDPLPRPGECRSLPPRSPLLLQDGDQESCYECCNVDDIPENTKKYAKARLEVCTCKFGVYPQIEAFIKSDRPTKFPNLSIRYVRGLDPIIKLMDKEGNVVETLAIDKWNTDSVEEFLKTYLEPVNNINLDYLQSNMV